MKKIIPLFILICFSCGHIKNAKPITYLTTEPLNVSKIRFDGFYNTLDTVKITYNCDAKGKTGNQIYTSINQVILYNNNIYVSPGGTVDDSPFMCEHYKWVADWNKEHKEEFFGSYTIKNDSIYAYLPVTIKTWGMISRKVKCNYRGYIKNKDTIVDWKIISPYPKGMSKFIRENNKDLFEPQTLYFVKTDAVKCLQMD